MKQMEIQFEEISMSPIEEAFQNYEFVHNDYSEGLNYGVGKELINRNLEAVEKILGKTSEQATEGMLAEDYLKMMFPLLQEVQIRLKEGEI